MSKRFYYDEFCEEIYDEEIQTYPSNQSICGILNKQAERIAELEEQLKNAIVPKFKIGQCAWFVYNKYQKFPFVGKITDFRYTYSKGKFYYSFNAIDSEYELFSEDCFFVSRAEAEEKLKELQGE